jgi:hypothetical protein
MLLSLHPVFAAPSFLCGKDPIQNTKNVQLVFDRAKRIQTIVLPPGVCVLAKCELANPGPKTCTGASGQHSSALYIGKRLSGQLDVVGDPSGTSVLKLDPKAGRLEDGRHAYCKDTHVVSVEKISHVTFRGFTIDGSHDLFDDSGECERVEEGKTKYGFSEHMHGLYLQNASDVEMVDMKFINAHGDGLNLIADIKMQPLTQGITVRDSKFLGNKRSGIGFQRNVSDVAITGNLFQNSGTDQDLDMESTGGEDNLGPINIEITNNNFLRAKAGGGAASGIAVTLGAGNTQAASGITFADNTIAPAAGALTPYGGCVFVYKAEHVTIRGNAITGSSDCYTVEARKVSDLTISGNALHGYRNRAPVDNDGIARFRPSGVVSVSVDSGKTDENCKGNCEYQVHYADGVTIQSNRIFQHVQHSSGIDLDGVDGIKISDNEIAATNTVRPAGVMSDEASPAGVAIALGVQPLGEGDFYRGERNPFSLAFVDQNTFIDFDNAVFIRRYPKITISSVSLTGNSLSSPLLGASGLVLKGESSFVRTLTVDRNRFGCGFVPTPPVLGANAFVRPSPQSFTGNIGTAIPGNPTPCLIIHK